MYVYVQKICQLVEMICYVAKNEIVIALVALMCATQNLFLIESLRVFTVFRLQQAIIIIDYTFVNSCTHIFVKLTTYIQYKYRRVTCTIPRIFEWVVCVSINKINENRTINGSRNIVHIHMNEKHNIKCAWINDKRQSRKGCSSSYKLYTIIQIPVAMMTFP